MPQFYHAFYIPGNFSPSLAVANEIRRLGKGYIDFLQRFRKPLQLAYPVVKMGTVGAEGIQANSRSGGCAHPHFEALIKRDMFDNSFAGSRSISLVNLLDVILRQRMPDHRQNNSQPGQEGADGRKRDADFHEFGLGN